MLVKYTLLKFSQWIYFVNKDVSQGLEWVRNFISFFENSNINVEAFFGHLIRKKCIEAIAGYELNSSQDVIKLFIGEFGKWKTIFCNPLIFIFI